MNAFDFVQTTRKELGLTQEDLTVLFNKSKPHPLKISRGMLSKYETGENKPNAEYYLKMKNVLKKAKEDKITTLMKS